jgi:hypothetical protein
MATEDKENQRKWRVDAKDAEKSEDWNIPSLHMFREL